MRKDRPEMTSRKRDQELWEPFKVHCWAGALEDAKMINNPKIIFFLHGNSHCIGYQVEDLQGVMNDITRDWLKGGAIEGIAVVDCVGEHWNSGYECMGGVFFLFPNKGSRL